MAKIINTPITANIMFNEEELKFLRALTQNSLVENECEEEKLIRGELFNVFSSALGVNKISYRGHAKSEIESLEEDFNVLQSRNISSLNPINQQKV